MKNLTILLGIILALMFLFLITIENRKDVDGYMQNTYAYTSGDVMFLASYKEDDILIATNSTTTEVKAIKQLDKVYEEIANYPNYNVMLEGEANLCLTYSPEKQEEIECESFDTVHPTKTEEMQYSKELDKFINVNKIHIKDYIILQ